MKPYGLSGIPIEAQSLYHRALDIKDIGKKEDALKYLKMAVMISPRFCNAYNAMGNCLDEMGQYYEAIQKYEKVLELNPFHMEARFKRDMVREKIRMNEDLPREV